MLGHHLNVGGVELAKIIDIKVVETNSRIHVLSQHVHINTHKVTPLSHGIS